MQEAIEFAGERLCCAGNTFGLSGTVKSMKRRTPQLTESCHAFKVNICALGSWTNTLTL